MPVGEREVAVVSWHSFSSSLAGSHRPRLRRPGVVFFLLSFSLLQRSSGGSNYLLPPPNLTLPDLPYLSTPPSTYYLPLYLNKIASSLLSPSLPP